MECKSDCYFSLCTKINSKCIKDLNVQPETLKLVKENVGETLQDVDINNDFISRTPTAQEIITRIDK
jgi:hypothetical protein